MINIGYRFYKEYFGKLLFVAGNNNPKMDGEHTLKSLKECKLNDYRKCRTFFINEKIDKENTIVLSTTYPGLLVGSGYIHEIGSKEIENELKLGFFFDHTTGLPIIPASSVKGLLRSAFEKDTVHFGDKKHKASLYVKELLDNISRTKWSLENINHLEKSIFEGDEGESIYNRDIFFDAFPTESENNNQTFIANDYITPHKNPLKNPNPIQFIKILPQVKFQFNFKLVDFKKNDHILLNISQKTELFKQILLDLGIGAKTNVGYGQFEDDIDSIKIKQVLEKEEREKKQEEEDKRKVEELEIKEQEEKQRIEEKHKMELELIRQDKCYEIIKDINDFNRLKREIERLEKLATRNDINIIINKEKIKPIIYQCYIEEIKTSKKRKKWQSKGKGNWYKIAQLFGEEIAANWFNEMTK